MDYKQKYEEALERAKMYQGIIVLPAESMIETIFPELRESEDEKRRKIITLCLEECVHSDIIRDYEKDDAIAWLEKQGQKPTWSEDDERHLNTTIAYLKDAKEFKKTAENCIDWLLTIKQRIGR